MNLDFDKHNLICALYITCMLQYICCALLLILRYKNNNNNQKFDIISIPILFSWLLHGFCIILPWIINGIYFGIGHVLSIISWVGLGLYIYEKRHPNMQTMQFIMICMGAAFVSLPYFFKSIVILDTSINTGNFGKYSNILVQNFYIFLSHFIFINSTYGILTWICVHIVIMIFLEKNLHNPHKYSYKFLYKCPPLLHMQEILKQRLYVLWYFMTFVIFTGIYLWIQEDLSYITHKIIFSLISWLIFLYFLHIKYKNGINSKKTIYYIIAIFAFWILSYIGSNFIINIIEYK